LTDRVKQPVQQMTGGKRSGIPKKKKQQMTGRRLKKKLYSIVRLCQDLSAPVFIGK